MISRTKSLKVPKYPEIYIHCHVCFVDISCFFDVKILINYLLVNRKKENLLSLVYSIGQRKSMSEAVATKSIFNSIHLQKSSIGFLRHLKEAILDVYFCQRFNIVNHDIRYAKTCSKTK